jgi:hypothetical protein
MAGHPLNSTADMIAITIAIIAMTAISLIICIISANTPDDDGNGDEQDNYASFSSYTHDGDTLLSKT